MNTPTVYEAIFEYGLDFECESDYDNFIHYIETEFLGENKEYDLSLIDYNLDRIARHIVSIIQDLNNDELNY
jgi:hypothetical protein